MLKQFLKEGLVYGIASIIPKLIGIVLIPFYTKVLTPEDYGVMNLVFAFYSLLIAFSIFSLDNSSIRWYYEKNEISERKSTVATWFWFQLFISLIIFLLVYIFSDYINEVLLDIKDRRILQIANLSFIIGVFSIVSLNWYRMRRNSNGAIIYSLSLSLLTIGLTVFFLIYLRLGVIGIFYAQFIAYFIMALFSIYQMRSWLNIFRFKYQRLFEMLKFAAPLVPTAIAIWALSSAASFFIESMKGKNELGVFQIGVTLSSALVILVFALKMAFPPFAYSIYKKKEASLIIPTILNLYSIVSVSLAFVLSLFSRELLVLFTQEAYYGADLTAGILFFYNIVYGYPIILGIGNSIAKDNKPIAVAVLFGASLTVILFFLLIPTYGKEGAAISMLGGYSIIPIYTFIKAQKKWYLPFKPILSILVFVTGLLLFVFSTQLNRLGVENEFKSKLVLVTIYLLIILLIIFLTDRLFFNKIRDVYKRLK